MSKSLDFDIALKLRLRRILFSQGYWTPVEVELSGYENQGVTVKRRSLTDLDVLGVKYDSLFIPHRIVGDCKSGNRLSDVNRLFWLRGVMDFFGADTAYFLHPQIDVHARAIAPKLNLRVLDDAELASLEKAIGLDSRPVGEFELPAYQHISGLWGIDVPQGGAPTQEQLKLKNAYSYLSYSYWYIEQHRNLVALVSHFEEIAPLLNSADPRHVLLAFVGAERFAHCLLDIASHVQSQGASEIPRYTRIYLYGGPLSLKDKEKFFELLRKATGVAEPLDPPWLDNVIELLARMFGSPLGASDVLRHLTAEYLHCVYLRHPSIPPLERGGGVNTPALVLSKDIAFTFARATGINRHLFDAITSL